MVQVLREEKINPSTRDLLIWVESDPPSNVPFPSSAIFELSIGAENIISPVTANIFNTNIFISADVAVNRTVFAADFGGKYVMKANERVLKVKREFRADIHNIDFSYNFKNNSFEVDELRINYNIKVLCYNRPASLSRLLRSLANADYGNERNISLEILIDSNKSADDFQIIQEVVHVAETFIWSYGPKR